jgi:hypothetical protein
LKEETKEEDGGRKILPTFGRNFYQAREGYV